MTVPTLVTAALLIVLGVFGYASQDPAGKVSPTAGLPALLGVLIGICGLLSFSDKLRKHAMHAAATLALLGAAGAPYPLIKMIVKGTEFSMTDSKVLTVIGSVVVCLVFVGLCVNSFVQVRRARKKAAAAG